MQVGFAGALAGLLAVPVRKAGQGGCAAPGRFGRRCPGRAPTASCTFLYTFPDVFAFNDIVFAKEINF